MLSLLPCNDEDYILLRGVDIVVLKEEDTIDALLLKR